MTTEKQNRGVDAIKSGLTDFLNADLAQLADELGLTARRARHTPKAKAAILAAE